MNYLSWGERMGAMSVTVSLPTEVLKYADRIARETRTSRSRVLTAMLAAEMTRRTEEEMALAYQESAAENEAIVESLRGLASKVLENTEFDA
jgi:predicted transcriptional regulator